MCRSYLFCINLSHTLVPIRKSAHSTAIMGPFQKSAHPTAIMGSFRKSAHPTVQSLLWPVALFFSGSALTARSQSAEWDTAKTCTFPPPHMHACLSAADFNP